MSVSRIRTLMVRAPSPRSSDFRLAAAVLVVLAVVPGAAQPEAEWKAGVAEAKVTPERPMVMAGYAGRKKPFERVEADLWVRALALEDRDGKRAVLITSDLIGFPASVSEPICRRIGEKTGLKREQILMNSSHTHSGPVIGLDNAKRSDVPEPDIHQVVEYTKSLEDKVVDAAARALQRMEPARLSWGTGVIDFGVNRREFTPAGVMIGVNPRGLSDRSVPVLRVDAADGRIRAVLFGAAVHGTTLVSDNYAVAGDYAGFAQEYVRQQQPGAMPLFMLGCAGDTNPYPRGTLALARRHGESLGKEVCRVLATKLQPVRGPLRVAFSRVNLPLQEPPSREEIEKKLSAPGMDGWVARQMLVALDRGEKLPRHYPSPVAVWQLGQDLTMVGLPGETVVDYIPLLEKAIGPTRLWIAGYCNDVFGYLPSARLLGEGGYECRGLYVGGIGYFAPQAEHVLVEEVRKLAQQAGR